MITVRVIFYDRPIRCQKSVSFLKNQKNIGRFIFWIKIIKQFKLKQNEKYKICSNESYCSRYDSQL